MSSKNRSTSRGRSRSRSRGPRYERSLSPSSSRNARIREFQTNRGLGLSVDKSSGLPPPADFFPSSWMQGNIGTSSSPTTPNSPQTTHAAASAVPLDFFPPEGLQWQAPSNAFSQIRSVKPIRAGPATTDQVTTSSFPGFAYSPAFASSPAFAPSPAFAGAACAGGGSGPECWSPHPTSKNSFKRKQPPKLFMGNIQFADLSDPRAASMQQEVMESLYESDPFYGDKPVVVPDFNFGDRPDYDAANAANISAPNLYNLPKTPQGGRRRTKKFTKRKRQTRRKTFIKRK